MSASTSGHPERASHGWWGPTLLDLAEGAVAVVTSALGLGIALLQLDGAGARSWLDVVAVAVLMAAGDRLVRPVVRLVAVPSGVVGALVAGVRRRSRSPGPH